LPASQAASRGGLLEIRAIFPDAVVRINQFRSIGKTAKSKRSAKRARRVGDSRLARP